MVPVKSLGELRFFSGCLYERDGERGTLKISQPTYPIQLVEKYGEKDGKSIPLPAGMRLGGLDENETTGNWPFRELVGPLMWLSTQTRPDIANAVRAVARYYAAPKHVHWQAAFVLVRVC